MTEYTGSNWQLNNADCIEGMSQMPSDCIDHSVFSSPFSSLYIYSDSERDMGNCASNEEFLQHHLYMAKELYRIMKPGAVIADHVKDTVFYQNSSETGEGGIYPFSDKALDNYRKAGFVMRARVTVWRDPVREMQKTKHERLLYKNIRENSRVSAMGMPEYVLIMRKESKGKNIGEPVDHVAPIDDRDTFEQRKRKEKAIEACVKKHLPADYTDEQLDALLREKNFTLPQWQEWASPVWMNTRQTDVLNARFKGSEKDEKHLCPMPLDLIERCLTLYSNPNDVIFDPFSGLGSTGYKALKMGRKFIGFELKPEYALQASKFLKEAAQTQSTLFNFEAA